MDIDLKMSNGNFRPDIYLPHIGAERKRRRPSILSLSLMLLSEFDDKISFDVWSARFRSQFLGCGGDAVVMRRECGGDAAGIRRWCGGVAAVVRW